jgi:HEPN domain-containing protein
MPKENSKIDIERTKNFWIKSSEEDYETMLGLYEIQRYSRTLFIGYISVEKLLKALYISKKGEHAPYIHNLYRLAELCDLNITE